MTRSMETADRRLDIHEPAQLSRETIVIHTWECRSAVEVRSWPSNGALSLFGGTYGISSTWTLGLACLRARSRYHDLRWPRRVRQDWRDRRGGGAPPQRSWPLLWGLTVTPPPRLP